ncbi:MAG: glycosyltransferase family 4 protein [Bacteroidales bacterium]|jgi:glycosyltransferase involved in cell wall biosynthesis|nr:glycosyltransferase family 4 protein [Bacteroidales bacterium]
MKLLILTQYFPPEVGAPQNRLFEVASRLQQRGVEVTILTAMPNYPQMVIHQEYKGKCYCKEQMSGMTIHRCWIYVPKSKALVKRLLNYFSFVFSALWYGLLKVRGKYDVLLVESPPLFLGITAYLLSRCKKAKMVFNVSDLWPESAEKLGLISNRFFLRMATILEEFCYRKSALISGQTQGIVSNIKARFPQKNVHWLKNGVDISKYVENDLTNPVSFRQEKGFETADFILLYGGIIGYAQGLDVILQAAEILKDKRDIKFVLLGNGPEKERLLTMKSDLALTNVYFYDAVAKKQMRHIIEGIDASIVPLKRLDIFKGAIPSKIFEYLAIRKPILLGVEGEAEELFIKQGKSGLAFEPDNAKDLSNKILSLYNDPQSAKEMGNEGFEYVKAYFSLSQIAEDFHNQLETLNKKQ